MSGPALPWANSVQQDAEPVSQLQTDAKAETTEEATYLTLEKACLAIGGRIDVKWQVEPDEGEPFMRWWCASVVGSSDQTSTQHPGAPVYEIVYDALEDFEQERCHVVFTGEHTLFQLDVKAELTWRRNGDTWEDDDDDDDEDDEEAAAREEGPDGEAVVTMDHLKKMVDNEREYLDGKTLEEAEQEALSGLEPRARIAMAAGFREFADGFRSFLEDRLADSAGGTVVVTAEHVRKFTEQLQKRQRTG